MSDEPDRIDPFGLPTTPLEQNPLFADPTPEEIAASDTAAAEAAAADVVEEKVVVPPVEPEAPAAPEAPAETPAAETPVVEETGEEGTVEELIFGKYKSMEEAQKGYDNLRDLQRRTAERARAFEQQHTTVLAQAQELETTLKQAIPYIQQLQRERQGGVDPGYAEQGAPLTAPMTPEMVDLMVKSRTDEMRQQFEQERQFKDDLASREASVYSFYEKHPEVEVEGELDGIMYDAIQALNEAWIKSDTEVNIGDADTLEIVYEATKSPALLKVLQLNPAYIDDDEGMQLARFQAALLSGIPITQQTVEVPASQVGQRKLPVTERASTGGSPPPTAPLNEWTEAQQALKTERHTESGSPFFE